MNEDEDAIERARAHGVDIERLRAMLQLTPTERVGLLFAYAAQGSGAVARAEAYGIDISLLRLALSWTPTQRVQRALEMADKVRALHRSGAEKHGTRTYPKATDHS